MNTSKETDELRAYLLGSYEGQDEKEKIEERLMLDEEYFQQFLLREEELIEDYIDDGLSPSERKVFESHFLIPVERRERVKLGRLLKNHPDEKEEDAAKAGGGNAAQKKRFDFRRFFLSPIPIGVSIVVVLGAFFLFWYFYSPDTNNLQKALTSLNKAYSAERPLESRVSGMDYAPFNKTRDQAEAKVNGIDRDRAERISLDEAAENPTVENQHLLARVYLAKGEFDKALELLGEAQKKSPQNAEILSDLGAVYLEKGKTASKGEEKLAFVASAIDSFDKALSIRPDLLSARFNKAIATEIYLPNRAREAWQEYLNLDQASKWADEAREHLKALDKQKSEHISNAAELESAFVKAYDQRNDERAFQIVSQNRELISQKYLPQRLAMTLVNKKKTKESRQLNS